MQEHRIKFWGVRGSFPTPDRDKIEVGGHSSCVEIRTSENELIIFDMGTGFIPLGKSLLTEKDPPKAAHVFISHFHWDHIMGFLYFTPFYDKSFTFNIYGFNKNTSTLSFSKKILDPTFWPVSMDMLDAKINFFDLEDNRLAISSKTSVSYANHSHPNSATSYRVETGGHSTVYTTDCEHENSNEPKRFFLISLRRFRHEQNLLLDLLW